MEQKHRFVSLAGTGKFTVAELCSEFRVSRKTAYKWLKRYRKEGAAGLRDRSRRPHGCAHQTAEKIERLILRLRRRHRTWGPKKLRKLLRRDHGANPMSQSDEPIRWGQVMVFGVDGTALVELKGLWRGR